MDTLQTYESNIRKYLALATDEQVQDGKNWYQEAHEWAVELSDCTGIEFDLVVRVIAVISPRLEWELNKQDAEKILLAWLDELEFVKSRAFYNNVRKAFDILNGQPDRLHGPKVECFYDNIARPDTSQVVTLDTHAWRIANDDPDITFNVYIPAKLGRIARQAYTEVAQEEGLLPYQVQAITWIVYKALHGAPNWR